MIVIPGEVRVLLWFPLKGDQRLGRCATEGCGQQPTFRLEVDGTGSNYCSACRARIKEEDDELATDQLNRC